MTVFAIGATIVAAVLLLSARARMGTEKLVLAEMLSDENYGLERLAHRIEYASGRGLSAETLDRALRSLEDRGLVESREGLWLPCRCHHHRVYRITSGGRVIAMMWSRE